MSLRLLLVIFIVKIIQCQIYPDSGPALEEIEIGDEVCQVENVTDNDHRIFFHAEPFTNEKGDFKLNVKIRGQHDGHIGLWTHHTEDSTDQPYYEIELGSYGNSRSDIRNPATSSYHQIVTSLGILSLKKFKTFIVEYRAEAGNLSVFFEGQTVPLLHYHEEEPVKLEYLSFATYHNLVQFALKCRPKDPLITVDESKTNRIFVERACIHSLLTWYSLFLGLYVLLNISLLILRRKADVPNYSRWIRKFYYLFGLKHFCPGASCKELDSHQLKGTSNYLVNDYEGDMDNNPYDNPMTRINIPNNLENGAIILAMERLFRFIFLLITFFFLLLFVLFI